MIREKNKGISIIEILFVITIIALVSVLVVPNLSSFRNEQVLNNTTGDIVSLINQAHSDTLSSLGSTIYGIHFTSTDATYFVGLSYTAGTTTNKVVTFDTKITIPVSGGINLNGGGSDIIFTRLSGDTTAYGTIVVRLISDATKQKTITISKTGSVNSY
jgi:type II secretory pathway pseudopilin PulG